MSNIFKNQTKKSYILAGLITSFLIQGNAFAVSTARLTSEESGKMVAPTKEDSADYFSKERKNISKEDAAQADVFRGKTIEQLKSMLAAAGNSNTGFELHIRLGELYVERSDFQRDQEIDSWTQSYENWKKADTKTRGKQPQISYKNSEAQLYLAVDSFRKLVNKFPKHPRTDAALYSLAGVLNRLNDENALLYYKQLISNHPTSPLVPDAYLAMGEYYFDKHKIAEATKSYQQVMDFKEHRAYAFAVYKLGWCYYNSQGVKEKTPGENLMKSISAFKLVVKLSQKDQSKNFNLRDEAIRDLVMAFAETEDTDAAWQYFKNIGEEGKFYAMLERLGGMYSDAGKTDKAIEVYKRLVQESPNRPSSPSIYLKMAELFDLANRPAEVVATISTMHKNFVDKGSSWVKANQAKTNAEKDAYNLTERATNRFGTMLHSRGQKTKNKQLEAHAGEIYQLYLTSFPSLDTAYNIRYYLADIQFAAANYEAASTNYMMVAKQKPTDGKHLKEAGLMAVAAIAKPNEQAKLAPVPPAGQVAKPLELPRLRKLYADTIDQYITLLPNEKDGISMRFTAAQIYFDYGHYDVSLKRFDTLALEYPSTKQGQAAVRVVLSYYNDRHDWTNLIASSQKYLKEKNLVKEASLKKLMEDCLRTAMFNNALALEKNKSYLKAAQAFVEFKKTFPSDTNADRSIYNASSNYFKAGKVDESIAQQKALLTEFPKSSLAPDVTASMAETFEAIAKFQDAADTYTAFASKWPSDKRAPTALYNAGVLYRGIKQSKSSAQAFSDLFKKYPTHPAARDALFEAARILESSGNIAGAISSYKLFASAPANSGKDLAYFAEARSYELMLKMNPKDETARKGLHKLSSLFRGKNPPQAFEARRVVASILFNEQDVMQKSFKSIKLNNGSDIENQAKRKQGALERLAAAYQEVIAIGNAEFSVASLYRLGELHEDFSKALFAAPAPAGASQADVSAFKSQLEKVAFPLKTEAYTYFETAFKRSQEVESFSEWTSRTYQKMVELAPQKHKDFSEQTLNAGYLSYKLTVNDSTKNLVD